MEVEPQYPKWKSFTLCLHMPAFFKKYKTFWKSICLYFPEIEKCNIYQHGNYILEVRDELKDNI